MEKSVFFLQVHSSLADVYLDLHMTSEAIAELETALTIRQHNKSGLEGDINRSATHQTLIRHSSGCTDNLGYVSKLGQGQIVLQASSNVLFWYSFLAVQVWALF